MQVALGGNLTVNEVPLVRVVDAWLFPLISAYLDHISCVAIQVVVKQPRAVKTGQAPMQEN